MASDNLNDLDGWTETTCAEAQKILANSSTVLSGLTDPDGLYGTPVVYTEWGDMNGNPTLRNYRWESEPCKHHVPVS